MSSTGSSIKINKPINTSVSAILFFLFSGKDGKFRKYEGPRDLASLVRLVEWRQWEELEALPSRPDSLEMQFFCTFFGYYYEVAMKMPTA